MSSRKRTPNKDATETPTAVAEPPAAANDNSPAAVAEPSAAEAAPDSQGFADRVGQKKPVAPDPFGIATDAVAGVRLFESKLDRQVAIKFGEGRAEDKPSQAVIDKMKEAGYQWNPSHRIWAHPVRSDSAMSTRIEAEKLYQEVRKMIRQEKGIEASQDVPF